MTPLYAVVSLEINERNEWYMDGIIGTVEFYAPVLVLGIIVIGMIYLMKKRNDKKRK